MKVSKIVEGDIVYWFDKTESKMELKESVVLEIIREKPDLVQDRMFVLGDLKSSNTIKKDVLNCVGEIIDKNKKYVLKHFLHVIETRIILYSHMVEKYKNSKKYNLYKELLEYNLSVLEKYKRK